MKRRRSKWAPDDIADLKGHGTMVASVVGGLLSGVASKANLVLVKYKQASLNPLNPVLNVWFDRAATEAGVRDAWTWIVNDVIQQRSNGNTGKFIVNMSAGSQHLYSLAFTAEQY